MKLHKRHEHNLPGVGYWGERGEVGLRINFGSYRAGEEFPEDKLHYHTTRTTYFCVIEGELIVEVSGERVVVTKEAMVEIGPIEKYRTLEVGEGGCNFVVIGSHNEDDRVFV